MFEKLRRKLQRKALRLTKVDVSHRSPTDPGVIWLVSNGFVLKFERDRVYLVK